MDKWVDHWTSGSREWENHVRGSVHCSRIAAATRRSRAHVLKSARVKIYEGSWKTERAYVYVCVLVYVGECCFSRQAAAKAKAF